MDDLALGPVRRLVILGELLVLLGEVCEEVLLVGVLVRVRVKVRVRVRVRVRSRGRGRG